MKQAYVRCPQDRPCSPGWPTRLWRRWFVARWTPRARAIDSDYFETALCVDGGGGGGGGDGGGG